MICKITRVHALYLYTAADEGDAHGKYSAYVGVQRRPRGRWCKGWKS